MSDTPPNLPELRLSATKAQGEQGRRDGTGSRPPPTDDMPNSVQAPELYASISLKRSVAWVIDVVILAILLGILWVLVFLGGLITFGLLWKVGAVISAILPAAYHAFLVGGPSSATVGMNLMGLSVRTIDGGAPGPLQAFVMVILFYTGVTLLTPLVLLVALFNSRRRCLHDILSGVVVVNRQT